MAHRIHLTLVGIVVILASACDVTAGLGPSPVAVEATVAARVNATLTAQAYNAAAAHVTETVLAAATVAAAATPTPPSPTLSPGAATVTPNPMPTPLMPVIAYFTCEPCAVEPGGAARLSWDLSGATAAYLDSQGVAAPGNTVVQPDQTTTYRLAAVNANGRSEKTVTVEVRGLPVIHYFTCLPCAVAKGQPSTLSWDLSGATAAYLDGHGVPAPGNTIVAPGQTTTYRLEAVGERGSVERLLTVTVDEGGNPEAVSQALRRLGYDVRSVGYLPLAQGSDTISVIMAAVSNTPQSQEVADQYFQGFKTLYDNYPGQVLTVGLYDGTRYIVFITVESAAFESLLRGETDSHVFWQVVTWNVWDDWTGHWLTGEVLDFVQQDYVSKNFLR